MERQKVPLFFSNSFIQHIMFLKMAENTSTPILQPHGSTNTSNRRTAEYSRDFIAPLNGSLPPSEHVWVSVGGSEADGDVLWTRAL